MAEVLGRIEREGRCAGALGVKLTQNEFGNGKRLWIILGEAN
jgi:hypothetical protein